MEKARVKTAPVIAGLVFLLGSLVAACGNSAGTTASVAPESSPSYEVLAKGGFVDPEIPRITAEDLKRRLDKGEKIVLIDTRSQPKFEMGHLAGAIDILYTVEGPLPGEEAAVDAQLSALPNDVLKVFYCS